MSEKIEILIEENTLMDRIDQMAKEISSDFENKDIVLICVLKGSIMFMVDLAKKLKQNVEFDFIDVSSYGNDTIAQNGIILNKDIETCIKGKNVILIEDIVDTGRTLNYLIDYLKQKEPNTLKICTLLEKPSRRLVDIKADYIGFSVPDSFIVGYGLDYAQKYRNLPYIGILQITNKEV